MKRPGRVRFLILGPAIIAMGFTMPTKTMMAVQILTGIIYTLFFFLMKK